MIHNLRMLGLSLLAGFTLSAVTASGASATDFFTAQNENAWLTGTSHDNQFSIGSTNFECTTAKFTGTLVNGADEMTVLPSYTGEIGDTPHGTSCDASLGSVTWDINHCHYVLTGNTTGSDAGTDATTWIQCPGTSKIQTTSSAGPVLSIPSQTPTEGGVTYTNIANHDESGKTGIRVTMTATGITTTCSPAFTCGLAGIPTHGNNTKWTGTMNFTGYEDPGGTFTSPVEGSKIAIEWS